MKRKPYLLFLLILLFLFQLYVPASIIFKNERVYISGTTYKIELAPIDPNDPFRGKYINLSFRQNTAKIPAHFSAREGSSIFVIMKPGKNGFLEIDSLSENHVQTLDPRICISARISYFSEEGSGKEAHIIYPFARFYVEESEAADAEERYRAAAMDSTKLSYGLLNVYNENAVLKEVIINGESLTQSLPRK